MKINPKQINLYIINDRNKAVRYAINTQTTLIFQWSIKKVNPSRSCIPKRERCLSSSLSTENPNKLNAQSPCLNLNSKEIDILTLFVHILQSFDGEAYFD